jgi:Holliday junction resolvasome RuvABC endonuclease subunit
MLTILAIDLGTKTGWALNDANGKITGGSESMAGMTGAHPAVRWNKFRHFLSDIRSNSAEIHICYYERVLHHTAVQAAHVYGALEALLQIWCHAHNIRFVLVSPGTIKKHWTGKGNAKKEEMIATAKEKGFHPKDDNHADAIALLSYAHHMENLLEELPF